MERNPDLGQEIRPCYEMDLITHWTTFNEFWTWSYKLLTNVTEIF